MIHNSGNDELNSIGYASSAPDFSGLAPATEIRPQDEVDLPALQRVSRVIKERRDFYNSNAALSSRDTKFSVEQQLEITQGMVMHLDELQSLVSETVQKVKERLNERN